MARLSQSCSYVKPGLSLSGRRKEAVRLIQSMCARLPMHRAEGSRSIEGGEANSDA
jgi:hypothetical protein